MIPRILIIAGSDSGGGAGIQADIKTVTMLGGHAMTAVTAVTAQNTLGVDAVHPIPTEMVLAQIDAVVDDIGIDAVKIGMIGAGETAAALAVRLELLPSVPIVFDPVMVATSGSSLADRSTVAAFDQVIATAALVTPNVPELEALSETRIGSLTDAEAQAIVLARRNGTAILAKGGHFEGPDVTDLLVMPDGSVTRWTSPRIDTRHTHGTGCTLASAITVGLAQDLSLVEAVDRARIFVRTAMLAAPGFGAGHGPMGHHAAASGAMNLNQVTLPAAEYAASVAFYRALGLTQIVASPPRYARFECPGGATLSIEIEREVHPGNALIYLESADLDGWVARLQAAGIVFDSLPEDQSWRWREARLRDPSGNRLCLYRAGENRRFPPWRLRGE